MNLMLHGLLYPMTRNKSWDIKKMYRLLIVPSMENLVQKGTSILDSAMISKIMFIKQIQIIIRSYEVKL